jgi:hypothetical protein
MKFPSLLVGLFAGAVSLAPMRNSLSLSSSATLLPADTPKGKAAEYVCQEGG